MRKSGKRKTESGWRKTENGKSCFPLSALRSPLSRRRGISLIEVLVSIFVLLFGLLAVAAMIPVAGLRIIQTNQADYSAACGQAGLRDVKVRRMLEPRKWLRVNPPGVADAASPRPNPTDPLAIPYERSFAIDPLGVAADEREDSQLEPRMVRFPYHGSSTNITMMRLTLDIDGANTPMAYALADRVFRWRDDVSIPIPTDPGERPQATIIRDSSANPLVNEIDGRYSWLVTVTPNVNKEDISGWIYIDQHRSYLVSVVVFFNRDLSVPGSVLNPDVPGERYVTAQVIGGGYGGGDVRLLVPQDEDADNNGALDSGEDLNASLGGPDSIAAEYLDLREGHWLMLCGRDTTATPPRDAFRWYRVVAGGETQKEDTPDQYLNNGKIDWYREVTLAGPDWTFGTTDVHAALFTRVIGVYTKTVELDDMGSLWAN